MQVGTKVTSTDHPKAIGTVVYVHANGNMSIQFETPASDSLPYGHIITEFWTVEDAKMLTVIFDLDKK